MKLINIADVPKIKVDMDGAKDAEMQIPIGVEEGTPGYSMRVFTLGPKGHTPYHSHDFEHINYIISGKGMVHRENAHNRWLYPGDCVLVQPDEMHQYINMSDNVPLVFICLVPKENECGCPDKEEKNEEVQS